ncbi:MAG: hypothetical protein Q7W44_10590 [Coriobacteriia bacterium]|nr:hypothetical protein [Coriobacteriia bacterium]
MPKMLYNCHGSWSCRGIEAADGRIIHAAGFAEKRDCTGAASEGFGIVDCDPLVWNLPYDPHATVCNKIATHAFLPIATPRFEDWHGKESEWIAAAIAPVVSADWPPPLPSTTGDIEGFIVDCLTWQGRLQPTLLTVPTPPLAGATPDLDAFLKWLRAGTRAASYLQPSETTLLSVTVEEGLLSTVGDVLLDQITAREGIDGVYLNVVTHKTELGERITQDVATSLVRFVRDLAPHRRVFVNGVDLFGLVLLGAGAEGIGIGYELKGMRLNTNDFKDTNSRGAFPRMLSLALCKRLALAEIEVLRNVGLLDRLESDRTDSSSVLLDAIRDRRDLRTIIPWRPTKGTVGEARRHYILRHEGVKRELDPMSQRERWEWVAGWLDTCDANISDFCQATGKRPQQVGAGHVSAWREAVSK